MSLRALARVARILRRRRADAGALQLASPEVRFEIDTETHDPLDVGMYQARAPWPRRVSSPGLQTPLRRSASPPPPSVSECLARAYIRCALWCPWSSARPGCAESVLTVSISKRAVQPALAALLRVLRGSAFSMGHGCDEAVGGGAVLQPLWPGTASPCAQLDGQDSILLPVERPCYHYHYHYSHQPCRP